MPQNLKTAVVGLAFAVFAIAGYQFIYKEGIWRPNQSTRSAINDAIGRADRITAQQARADLDALLARAEKGERLDRAELERLIKAAATDAGSLDALWKEAETKSRGQVTAPLQLVQPEKPVPTTDAVSQKSTPSPQPEVEEESPPRPPRDTFFDKPFVIAAADRPPWMPIKKRSGGPYGLEIEAELIPKQPDLLTLSGRTAFSYRGIPFDELIPSYRESDNVELRQQLDLPKVNVYALIGRYCDVEGCNQAFPITTSPVVVCPAPGQWLEVKMNHALGLNYQFKYDVAGFINLRPLRANSSDCPSGDIQ